MSRPLDGKVALVAGATRGGGRGIAVALGEAGATVYVTGRSTRAQRSEIGRPETIEETAELVTAAGGEGIAVPVDHLEPAEVAGLALERGQLLRHRRGRELRRVGDRRDRPALVELAEEAHAAEVEHVRHATELP